MITHFIHVALKLQTHEKRPELLMSTLFFFFKAEEVFNYT